MDKSRCDDRGKQVITADTNGDKRPDVLKLYASSARAQSTQVLVCKQVDLNNDGKVDIVYHYGDDSALTFEEFDLDFDGRFDLRAFYQGGRKVREELDTNYDQRVDFTKYYEADSWSGSSATPTTTAGSTSGNTTRRASSTASASTAPARAGSIAGSGRPRKRPARPPRQRAGGRAAPAHAHRRRPATTARSPTTSPPPRTERGRAGGPAVCDRGSAQVEHPWLSLCIWNYNRESG